MPWILLAAFAPAFLTAPLVARGYTKTLGLADMVAALSVPALLYVSPPQAAPAATLILMATAYTGFTALTGRGERNALRLLYALSLAPALVAGSEWLFTVAVATLALLGMAGLSYLWLTLDRFLAAVEVSLALSSYAYAAGLYAEPFSHAFFTMMLGFAFIESFSMMPPLRVGLAREACNKGFYFSRLLRVCGRLSLIPLVTRVMIYTSIEILYTGERLRGSK